LAREVHFIPHSFRKVLYPVAPVGNVRVNAMENLESICTWSEICSTDFSTNIVKGDCAMIIGNFRYDAEHDTYAGDIATLTLQRSQVVMRPNDKSSEKEPDYRIAV
jgi:hypothetical protein